MLIIRRTMSYSDNPREQFGVRSTISDQLIGPHPLLKRGAEIVVRVIHRLPLDFTYPPTPEVWAHNNEVVKDKRLQAWLENRQGA